MFMHEAWVATFHFPTQIFGSIYVVHYDDWWELDELTRSVVIESHQHYLNLNLQQEHIFLHNPLSSWDMESLPKGSGGGHK